MHEPQRSGRHALDQTWRHSHDVRAAQDRVSSVSTVRVRFVGTPSETAPPAQPSFARTKRYARVLPSLQDCIPHADVTDDALDWRAVSWRDVTCLDGQPEPSHARHALAYAQTLPAIPAIQLDREREPEDSGVREISRLRLSLELHDSDRPAAQKHETLARADSQTNTMRLTRSGEAPPLTRAWQRWQQQPPFVAITTALTFCLVSALVASWLAP